MTTVRNLGLIALVAISVVVVFLAGFGARWLIDRGSTPVDTPSVIAANGDAAQPGDMHVFWEAWHILQRDFYGDAIIVNDLVARCRVRCTFEFLKQ